MYCVKCGVNLADTEKACPLCGTRVYHPEVTQGEAQGLYPKGRMPKTGGGRAFLCGAVIILFMIPLVITFFSDLQPDGRVDWFGYVAGGLAVAYLTVALPMWFKAPHPIIFVPCDFAACAVYLLYINLATGGDWFFPFALPVVLGTALIVCALVTLLLCLRRGKLYAVGGAIMAFGGLILMIELLIDRVFHRQFTGWSVYPLIPLLLVGGLLIYLAMNSVARERIERKIFF